MAKKIELDHGQPTFPQKNDQDKLKINMWYFKVNFSFYTYVIIQAP